MRRDLKATTAVHYRGILDKFILPLFGDRPAVASTPTDIADWNHELAAIAGNSCATTSTSMRDGVATGCCSHTRTVSS
ncbi:MAG: hypothetical protein ACYC1Z_00460 [Georgenia sp.]